MRATGRTIKRTVADEAIDTFVPHPFPPRDPPLSVDGEFAATLARAEAFASEVFRSCPHMPH